MIGNETKLMWVDTETTGLNPHSELLEVGMVVTEGRELDVIDQFSLITRKTKTFTMEGHFPECEADALAMHLKSGLIEDWLQTPQRTHEQVTDLVTGFYREHFGDRKVPMCGSTVGFDRRVLEMNLPAVENLFHYRSIDVSSFKALGAALDLPEWTHWAGEKQHRVISDLEDSIEELRFYLNRWGIL